MHRTLITDSLRQAERWFRLFEGAGLDGVIAKPPDLPYLEDQRVMFKVKHERTADCVVAGFRWHKKGPVVGSLLLGLHDEDGKLQHVGVSASFSMERRRELLDELAPYRLEPGDEHPWTGYSTPERVPGAHGVALERQEGPVLRAAGRRSWWSRSPTTTWRATASATPPSSAAGATTATPSPAPTTSSSGRSSSTWATSWPAATRARADSGTALTGKEMPMDQRGGQEPIEPQPRAARTAGRRPLMVAYASALDAGDAGLAAGLYAENALLTSADERLTGRSGIAGWHEDLLSRGAVTASPVRAQGNDTGRLEVDGPTGRQVVELAFDASGRIGTARWLTTDEAAQPQEERERTAT